MIVLLTGPPAAGKRTVGALLAERTGARLIDNHLINDPVFTALGADGRGALPEVAFTMADRVREVVYEAVLAADPRISHIFTSWLIDTPQDAAKAEQFRALAARRGTDYHPVWLTCDEDELRRRVELPDRLVRNKLRDPSMVAEAVGRGVAGAPDDALRIDTSSITAGETADRIAAWISDRGAC